MNDYPQASYTLSPVGIVHSPFREKFGIPRQSGLMPAAAATVELLPPCNRMESVRGLDGFSHLWLCFVFHGVPQGEWSPTVRPPKLGGNQRVGVFASRSPFRPNPLGLSLVELLQIEQTGGQILLHVRGADLLDGTPVLDIKPYLPYVDSQPLARSGYACSGSEARLRVQFSAPALEACRERPGLRTFIEQMLRLDPRPGYAATEDVRVYGTRIFDCNVRWQIREGCADVLAIEPVAAGYSG